MLVPTLAWVAIAATSLPAGDVSSARGIDTSIPETTRQHLLIEEPLRDPLVAQVYVEPAPIPDSRGSLFLIGLGLVGSGLVLGGAGFGVLYYCGQGTGYCTDTVNTLGW